MAIQDADKVNSSEARELVLLQLSNEKLKEAKLRQRTLPYIR